MLINISLFIITDNFCREKRLNYSTGLILEAGGRLLNSRHIKIRQPLANELWPLIYQWDKQTLPIFTTFIRRFNILC